jgi:Sulfotransferase family
MCTQSVSSANDSMSPGPLFVVGIWRSGTSLLHTLLNQHPQIRLMYESDLPLLWPLFLVSSRKQFWLSKWESWNGVLSRHHIDASQIPDGHFNMPLAMRAVCVQYALNKQATIWGCKSPNYYNRLNWLAEEFPSAKFIVIWRDLGQICDSIAKAGKQAPWFARRGMDLRAILGYHRLKQETDRLSRRGWAIHQLHYEEMTQDPAGSMRTICEFLGIPFDAKMTSLDDADRSAVYSGKHHAVLNGSTIVPPIPRPQLLQPRIKSKIDRYVAFWRKRYRGEWPVYADVDGSVDPVNVWERISDQVMYLLLRGWDLLTPLVYQLVPTGVWNSYRRFKLHNSPQQEAK